MEMLSGGIGVLSALFHGISGSNGLGTGFIIVSACLLFAASALHLAACLMHRDGLRKPTKVLLMPLVAFLHISVCGLEYPLLLIGLFCGWLGDIFLIPKDRKLTFVLGAFFFMVGHAFYITNAFTLGLPGQVFAKYGRVSVVIALLAAVAICFTALMLLRKRMSKKMLIVFVIYMTALAFMAGTMIYSTFAIGMKPQSFMIGVGALLFAVSDFLLGSGIVRAFRIKNNRFWVMLTYILAQTGIALGFALL